MSSVSLRPAFGRSVLFPGRLTLSVPYAKAAWLRKRLRDIGLDAVACFDPNHRSAALEFGQGTGADQVLRALHEIDAESYPVARAEPPVPRAEPAARVEVTRVDSGRPLAPPGKFHRDAVAAYVDAVEMGYTAEQARKFVALEYGLSPAEVEVIEQESTLAVVA
jgi:hypothetical protein